MLSVLLIVGQCGNQRKLDFYTPNDRLESIKITFD